MHASTIALDFDLDYSNQFDGQVSYNKYGKQTCRFYRSWNIIKSFLFLGNLLSNMIAEDTNELMGYDIFFVFNFFINLFFTAMYYCIKLLNFTKLKFKS